MYKDGKPVFCDGCGREIKASMKLFECERCGVLVCFSCAKEESFECQVCEPSIPELLEVDKKDY